MPKLKLEFMPEATQKNFARLKDDPRLAAFTLVGGTALALQIGHRFSEDLDFNIFGQKLPTSAIASVISWATGQSRAVTSARAPARVCSGSSVADSPSTASEDRR